MAPLEPSHHLDESFVQGRSGEVRELTNQDQTREAFDDGDDRLSPGPMNRVDFPMSELGSVVRGGRTVGDVAFAGVSSAALVRGVALPAAPGMLAQITIQLS